MAALKKSMKEEIRALADRYAAELKRNSDDGRVKQRTRVDLLGILNDLAVERAAQHGQ